MLDVTYISYCKYTPSQKTAYLTCHNSDTHQPILIIFDRQYVQINYWLQIPKCTSNWATHVLVPIVKIGPADPEIHRSLRNRKNWTWSRKFTKIPSIWWKDHRYWDSFAHSKKKEKKEEINASKIYSPVSRFAEQAKLRTWISKTIKLVWDVSKWVKVCAVFETECMLILQILWILLTRNTFIVV